MLSADLLHHLKRAMVPAVLLQGRRSRSCSRVSRMVRFSDFVQFHLLGQHSTLGAGNALGDAERRVELWRRGLLGPADLEGEVRGGLPLAFATPSSCLQRTSRSPDDLRDQLGLSHLRDEAPAGGVATGVLRYEWTRTLTRLDYRIAGAPTYVPTVLDSGFYDAFGPTHRHRNTGWTRSLVDDSPGFPEIVHAPVPATALVRAQEVGALSAPPSTGWRERRKQRFVEDGHVRV